MLSGLCDYPNVYGEGFCSDEKRQFGTPIFDGCTDEAACNYNAFAFEEDNSCLYDDSDGDGICDLLEIPGCQTPRHAISIPQMTMEVAQPHLLQRRM